MQGFTFDNNFTIKEIAIFRDGRIHAVVLAEKLREEMEKKGVLPPNQTGFRREVGTIDNIYVLNYIINKQLERRGGRLAVLFVNLKEAFDTLDRKVLIKAMQKKKIKKELMVRVEEMVRETKSRVRVEEVLWEGFWTAREVRRGLLSPMLFNVLIADLE